LISSIHASRFLLPPPSPRQVREASRLRDDHHIQRALPLMHVRRMDSLGPVVLRPSLKVLFTSLVSRGHGVIACCPAQPLLSRLYQRRNLSSSPPPSPSSLTPFSSSERSKCSTRHLARARHWQMVRKTSPPSLPPLSLLPSTLPPFLPPSFPPCLSCAIPVGALPHRGWRFRGSSRHPGGPNGGRAGR